MRFKPDYSSRFRILKGGKISLVVSALLGSMTFSFAAPSGGVVTSGSASINQSGKVTNINQSTQKASINWQKFNVAIDETVNFNQPNVNSITLNRVVGNERSVINGALNANGQVWILNSNGVLFGKNASINTAGLLATTKELSDQDFQAGNYNFKGDSTASVINLGEIDISDSGYATLLANTVSNEGTIKAVKGQVHLVGANEVTINLNGNSIVDLTVDKGVLDALVENKGAVYADGGEIYLTTNAVDELLKGVVNNAGIIEANSFESVTGYVELFAHGGEAKIGGTIEAKDGFVETSGKEFTFNDAKIEAGEWLIDPVNVTIDDSLATAIETALGTGDVTIETDTPDYSDVDTSSGESGTDGNIYVNSEITWNTAQKLTLDAYNDIFINKSITATNAAGQLALYYGQGAGESGNTADYYVKAPINLKAGDNFFTKLGSDGLLTTWTVVTTASDLQSIALGGNSVLGADVDASGITNWTPIGSSSDSFTGNFDGLGHTISNLEIYDTNDYRDSTAYLGLFGYIGSGASVRNFGLVDMSVGRILLLMEHDNINSTVFMGGLAGVNEGTISNVYATGRVDNYLYAEGLSHDPMDPIGNATNYSNIAHSIGGLTGTNKGNIENSYVTADVHSYRFGNFPSSSDSVGGLTGSNEGGIQNSYASNLVTGNNSFSISNVGGLIGSEETGGSVENSFYDTEENTWDSGNYGKTKAEILTAFSSKAGWTTSIDGSAVAGYGALALPYLAGITRDEDRSVTTLFESGMGEEANPYTITNWNQLQNINHSNILTQNYYFSLLNNLGSTTDGYTTQVKDGETLANSGTGWNPIGGVDENTYFVGFFDGKGHTIDSLAINAQRSNVALFGYIGNNGTVANLGVTNVDIHNDGINTGGLSAVNQGTISNSYVTGNIYSKQRIVGGIASNVYWGSVTNSYSLANTSGSGSRVGTLIGNIFQGSVTNSYGSYNNINTVYNGTITNKINEVELTKEELRNLATKSWSDNFWSIAAGGANVEGYEIAELPYLKNVTAEADKPNTFTLFEGGFGTEADAYEITNWTQLQNINNSNILTQGYYFELLNNLGSSTDGYTTQVKDGTTLANSGKGWNPIGDSSTAFKGTFDGNGHIVDSLYINTTSNDVGLFGVINDASIKNLGVTNADISGNKFVGILVGRALQSSGVTSYSIANTYSTGKVTATGDLAGGLIGALQNTPVSNSYSLATVSGSNNIGGLVGGANSNPTDSDTSITNSYASGTVSGSNNVGGLVGFTNDSIINSYYDKDTNTDNTMSDLDTYGKTTEELRDLALEKWDIETYSATENTYPTLAWQESGNSYTKTWIIGIKETSSGGTTGGGTTGGGTTGGGTTGGGTTGGGTTGGGTTGGGTTPTPTPTPSPTPSPEPTPELPVVEEQQKEVEKVITTIVNQEAVTITPPRVQTTTTTPNNVGQNVAINFGMSGNQMLISQPIEGQATQRITLGQARQMQLENGVSGEEVRVPLSRSSMIELVNGGVSLPDGVEQEFYVAENN